MTSLESKSGSAVRVPLADSPVRNKVHAFPSPGQKHKPREKDDAEPENDWQPVLQRCKEMEEVLKEALEAWRKEVAPQGTVQATPAARRVKVKRMVTRLSKASKQASEVQVQMTELLARAATMQQELTRSEQSRSQAVSRLQTIAEDLEGTLERLKEEEGQRESVAAELARSTVELAKAEQRAQEAEQNLLRMERQLADERSEAERLETENRTLRQEVGTLQGELAQTTASCETKEAERVQANQAAADSAAVAARYTEVVAKLTGDNMVLLMKLHTCERKLQYTEDQARELRAQVELRRGEWLEKARAEVEGQVKKSIRKAEESTLELHAVQAAAKGAAQAAACQLANVRAQLEQEQTKRTQAEEALGKAQSRLRELGEECQVAAVEAQQSAEARREAQAEVRVLKADVERVDRVLKEQTEKVKALEEEVECLKAKLSAKEADSDRLSFELEIAAAALAKQQAVNEALMKKKQEMEWQYLEALGEREAATWQGKDGRKSV